jgi:hypothetical protein
MRRITTKAVSLAVVLTALVGVSVSAAYAETLQPWWHLRTSTRPTNIQPGTATDEVQQVTVAAGVESYRFEITGGGLLGLYPGGVNAKFTVTLTPEESAGEIQAALGEMYGPGNVEVTARQQNAEGVLSYDVRFVGKLTDLPVGVIEVVEVRRDGEDLAAVRVKQLALGRPDGEIVLTATNAGDASAPTECVNVGPGHGDFSDSGCTIKTEQWGEGEFEPRLREPVKISDVLPKGLHVVAIEGSVGESAPNFRFGTKSSPLECSPVAVSCEFNGKPLPSLEGTGVTARGASAHYPNFVAPFETLQVFVAVNVTGEVTEQNTAAITGGDAPAASVKRPLTVSGAQSSFGLNTYEMSAEEPGGAPDTQAGSHPFQLTTTQEVNQTTEPRPVGLGKDFHFNLPPGLLGDPSAIPRCTLKQFDTPGLEPLNENLCPTDTVIGVNVTHVIAFEAGSEPFVVRVEAPIFNLEPSPGEPARFGFVVEGTPVLVTTAVRTGGDYGVTATASDITQSIEFLSNEFTLWGVPGAQTHDKDRGRACLFLREREAEGNGGFGEGCHLLAEPHPPAFLSLPTSCTGKPLESTVEGDSWEEPHNVFAPFFTTTPMVTLAGCNHLPFLPSIKVTPDSEQASKPTGLDVDVHVNQNSILNPEGLAQSAVRDITVKLPAGVAIDPSSGDGLEACSEGLVGFEAGRGVGGFGEFPTDPGVSYPIFSSYLPGSIAALAAGDQEQLQPGKNFCPNPSKIAEVTIHSPLLPSNQPLKGFVYLAAQEANPFGSVLAMYIVAEDPISGTLVKLPGKVMLCQAAGEVIAGMTCEALGQIVSTFENEPQLPFEDAELHFFGGERAPLTSPTRCGSYTTEASYTPWSGGEPVNASSTFNITSGPNGAPCPGAQLPFNPSLTGGATNVNAGAFSPFTLTMSRLPGEQNLQSVEAHLPPGLSGILSNIELCPEPQANEGLCPEASKIGETTVSVGVGGEPYTVSGGKFFITGPYNGTSGCTVGQPGCAPFGITFEVPAKAGPYDFAKTQRNHPACDCVLVRGKIEINPYTAALTVTSNPPGTPDAIPTSIEGIPLEIQHVNAITTRGNFQFNPTNCNKMAVTGTIHSSEGGADTIGVPFQVTNCQALKFTPKFTVSTSGKTSKANGADLVTKVTEPSEPFGSQANIAKVKVELPLQLPSRLTTLQKACTAAQFEKNPAGCPSASFIGHAVVHTPLIPVPLEGPAIFVSHGNESFPSLTMVLQGYGVTIDLVGATFISKTGITSTTFKTVPDQPFSTFELTLPEGKYSALAANGNLCKPTTTKLVKKKVTVRVKGRKKTETRKVREAVATSLVMPNEFVAQNGAVIKQDTAISVTGCSKTVVHSKKGKKHHEAHGKKQGGAKQ